MSSLVMGAKGLLSGAGSVIAHLQVQLYRAVKDKDLDKAQKVNDQIFPLAQAFYSPPFLDMHNRMKEVLVLTGKMDEAFVRPPLMKLSAKEIDHLKQAVALSRI
jgi:4-hydroxy-tetrahydrodipicolinate synthase